MRVRWTTPALRCHSATIEPPPELHVLWRLKWGCQRCGRIWAIAEWVETGLPARHQWLHALCPLHDAGNPGRLWTPYTRLYLGDEAFPREIIELELLKEISNGTINTVPLPNPRPEGYAFG